MFSLSALLLLATTLTAGPRNSCAGGALSTAPTSCDPEYMDALEARAYMEAQREISQNKNLIFKPDSVLEYSCFGQFLNNLAGDARLFSEQGCCGTGGLGLTSLDLALQNAVGTAMVAYLNSNFRNSFLNGRTTDDYTFGSVTGGAYDCDRMQRVWDDAKCMDFGDQANHDMFYDFGWYATNDPRTRNLVNPWSAANSCAVAGAGGATVGSITAAEANVAYNNQSARYIMAAENPLSDANPANDFAPYVEDPVQSYYNLILPLNDIVPGTTTTVTCAAPILTGVCVKRSTGPGSTVEYPDAVCPNPGCHLLPGGSGGGGTTCSSTVNNTWCVGP